MEYANAAVNRFFTLPFETQSNPYHMDRFDPFQHRSESNLATLMEQIPVGSRVLDIGCADGILGDALSGKQCAVFGIDINEQAVELARQTRSYEWVQTYNIATEDIESNCKLHELCGNIDVVIFSDVLEHLTDPTTILRRCTCFLKEQGCFLISVPNISHSNIILNLMEGNFNYSDLGILDRTHVKFFTKQSFCEWIRLIRDSFKDFPYEASFLGETYYIDSFSLMVEEQFPELSTVLRMNPNSRALQLIFALRHCNINEQSELFPVANTISAGGTVETLGKALQGKIAVSGQMMHSGEAVYLQELMEARDQLATHSQRQKQYIVELEASLLQIHELAQDRAVYIDELETRQRGLDKIAQDRAVYIDELETRQRELDKIAQDRAVYIDELETRQRELDKIAQDRATYIDELEANLRLLDQVAANRAQYISTLNECISQERAAHLKNVEEIEESWGDRLGIVEKELTNAKQTILDMEQSLSWRITKILRRHER